MSARADNEQKKRITAGYEIFDSINIGKAEFVVGRNIHAPSQYVTWECSNGNNYFWGHYFSDRSEALRDMYSRAEAEISFIKNSIRPTKKREEREER